MDLKFRRAFSQSDSLAGLIAAGRELSARFEEEEPFIPGPYRPATLFQPHRVVRNGSAQTILARRRPPDSVARRLELPVLLDAGYDYTEMDADRPVRMLGYYNAPLSAVTNRGLVLLIHGWHGSSHSADLLYIADALLRAGFATFRINLRDHGPNLHADSLALNRGVFLGTLLDEVLTVTQQIALLANGKPFYLIGGSMGGNFVLRLADRHNSDPIPGLAKVVALCPAVNPSSSIDALDSQSAYRTFFRARWIWALKAKQRHFPDLYDFSAADGVRRMREITDLLITQYGPWKTADEYFAAYAVDNAMVTRIRVPTTIIAARDDAVIPLEDILALEPHDYLSVQVQPTGGHMGFVDLFPYRRWLPQAVISELRQAA
jgi:predicted alpha/beta-fold hydrolase